MPSPFDSLNFTNRFATLPEAFYSTVQPQPIENAKIISFNPHSAELIGLDANALEDKALLQCLTGNALPSQAHPLASVYSGHQFGQYNPQLGDGRALLLGETCYQGQSMEWQLKGSGMTPYSRMGDGRAVLRSSIREYLCQEAMHGLGIPTTRSLAITTSTTPVYRETVETASTLIRLAENFIRFGHFEYFFYTKQQNELKRLVDFVIQNYFPDLLSEKNPYTAFLLTVVKRTAQLIAQWQAYGFCHGVMNTDNMSILGLTLDYGPFAFLDDFSVSHICNHSDHTGRYAFNQQVNIGLWNLNALAHSLSGFIDIESIRNALMQYETTYASHYRELMLQKLGLAPSTKKHDSLIADLLTLLDQESCDYSLFFRELSHFSLGETPTIAQDDNYQAWLNRYWDAVKNTPHAPTYQLNRLQVNPKFILRNHLAQKAIEQAQQQNFVMLNDLLKVLQAPFDEHPEHEEFALPPKDSEKHISISCSS